MASRERLEEVIEQGQDVQGARQPRTTPRSRYEVSAPTLYSDRNTSASVAPKLRFLLHDAATGNLVALSFRRPVEIGASPQADAVYTDVCRIHRLPGVHQRSMPEACIVFHRDTPFATTSHNDWETVEALRAHPVLEKLRANSGLSVASAVTAAGDLVLGETNRHLRAMGNELTLLVLPRDHFHAAGFRTIMTLPMVRKRTTIWRLVPLPAPFNVQPGTAAPSSSVIIVSVASGLDTDRPLVQYAHLGDSPSASPPYTFSLRSPDAALIPTECPDRFPLSQAEINYLGYMMHTNETVELLYDVAAHSRRGRNTSYYHFLHGLVLPINSVLLETASAQDRATMLTTRVRCLLEVEVESTWETAVQCGVGSPLLALKARATDHIAILNADTGVTLCVCDSTDSLPPGSSHWLLLSTCWGGGVLHLAYEDSSNRPPEPKTAPETAAAGEEVGVKPKRGPKQVSHQCLTRLYVRHVTWRQALAHGHVPPDVRARQRALVAVRVHGGGGASPESGSDANASAAWAGLPLEVFEQVLECVWSEYLRPKLMAPGY